VLVPPPTPVAEVSDLQGSIPTSPARVTLFLFEVVEDPSAKNRPHVSQPAPPGVVIQKPPMALLLRYMLTPWSGDRATDHRILGRVLQTLYDGAIISGAQLQGGLAGSNEALKVTLAPISLEDRARVWYAVQKPYRLSLTYEVRVVNLDTVTGQRVRAVSQRVLSPSVPGNP
jgi:hypothetical protein